MINPKPISLDSLIVEIQRLSQEKITGTIFISADNRRTAQINLLKGNIVALSCLNMRGMKALLLIRQLNPNWFKFIQGTSVTTDSDLPSTADILNSLISSCNSISESSGSAANTQQTDAVLQETLMEFMGPVAPLICNKVLPQARNLDEAIDLLAHEIPDRQQALSFKEQVGQKILLLNSESSVAPASPNSGSKSNVVIEIISQKTRTVLQEALVEFMGPVAPLICNKVLRRVRSLDQAIDLLTQEISDQKQAARFKDQVRKKLL